MATWAISSSRLSHDACRFHHIGLIGPESEIDAFANLRYLFEPYVFLLDDSPDTWAEALSGNRNTVEEPPPGNVTNVE